MSDQAELLRKRREARQKKILASGESRLSKITGTAGTSTQVAPSPAVLHAREQLLKKEQEEERLKALKAAGGDLSNTDNTAQGQQLDNEEEELVMPSSPSQHATADRIARQRSASSAHNATNNTTSTTNAGARTGPTTVEDANDADPDDSLGAPPTHVPLPFGSNNSQQNPFMNNMFNSPQHQQALTRMMQEDNSNNGSNNVAATQNPFGNAPPGFTVITPQVDQTARWWKLLHFIMSALFGLTVVYSEHSRHGDFGRFDALATDKPLPYGVYQVAPIPVFWYFVTMELILQSTRMALNGVTASPSSTLGTIAGFLPSPFSDAIRVFMRYRLIWSSMVSDLSVVVFFVGLTIVFTHMFS